MKPLNLLPVLDRQGLLLDLLRELAYGVLDCDSLRDSGLPRE